MRPISTWDDLARELRAHPNIGTLVLMTHGVPGGILLDSWKDAPDARAFLHRTGARAKTIIFEGCMVMQEPVDAAEIAKGLRARWAVGYNWWHFTGRHTWKLNSKPAPADLKEEIAAWMGAHNKYLIRSRGAATLNQLGTAKAVVDKLEKITTKKTAGKVPLYMEWFHPHREGNTPDLDIPDPARANLKKKTIASLKDAESFTNIKHFTDGPYEVTLDVNKVAP
jgi:hypothetical protein